MIDTADELELLLLSGAGRRRYSRKVLATAPIAYWMLDETSGETASDSSGNARHGSYSGVTLGQAGIGDGRTCPSFDGINDLVNVYTTSLRDAFNGGEGSVLAWAKVASAGAWSDGAWREVVRLQADSNNQVLVDKNNISNQMRLIYTAGGTGKSVIPTVGPTTGWVCYALTWSRSSGGSGEMRAYVNGAQVGSTQAGLGNWAGTLGATSTCVGAANTTPQYPWSGSIAHVAVWDRCLAAGEVARLSRR